jgi:FixJ family two-component response regulator
MGANIAVIDDDLEFSRSLRVMLEHSGYEVQTFHSAEEFLAYRDSYKPACVLLDERMTGMSGLDAHRELQRRGCASPVVMLTGHATVPLAIRAFEQGMSYFLEKPVSRNDLLERVERCVARSEANAAEEQTRQKTQQRLAALSLRERQVAAMIAEGALNKQIAATLNVSLRTVETYRSRVSKKLQVSSNADIVAFAIASGLRNAPLE